MRIFKTKWLARFIRREGIDDQSLGAAIERAEQGLIDADLAGVSLSSALPAQDADDPAGIA